MKFPKIILGVIALPFLFGFTNIAHRGDNQLGKYSEHSYQAYDRALAEKADYLEMDIERTADGVLVVSHDNNLSKIYGVNVNITDSNYADLKKYRNESGEPLHTLAEVFERYKSNPNIKFMIETKNETAPTGMEHQLVNLINQYGLQNRVLFESFSPQSLQLLAQLAPNIPRTQLDGDYKSIGNNQYYANGKYSPEIAHYLKINGKKYLVWGVDTPEEMRALTDIGNVEGILTDFPGKLSEVLGVKSYSAQNIKGSIIINYIGNYSVNVWNGYGTNAHFSGKRLRNGTKHPVCQVAIQNGKTWYNVGNNQWLDGQYVSFYPISKAANNAPSQRKGIIQIKYVSGYGVNLWGNYNGTHFLGRRLQHGTRWKYFGTINSNGRIFYNLGGNQWIDGKYAVVVK